MMKRSVKTRLTAAAVITAAVFAAAFSAVSAASVKRSAGSAVTSLIDNTAVSAAGTLSGKIEAVTAVSDDLSGNDAALNRAVDEIRLRLLRDRNERYSAEGMGFDIAYADTLVSIDGVTSYQNNEAVRSAASGKALMSAPYKKNGEEVVCYAAPLTEPYYDRDCVLICTADCGFFDDVFGTVSLGQSCAVYLSDRSGVIAGQPSGREDLYSVSVPVEQREGWTLTVEADPAELMPDLTGEIISAVLLSAAAATVFCAVMTVILNKTLGPLKRLTERLSALAEGDFSSPVPEARSRDESYETAAALNRTAEALRGCINEIAGSVNEVAAGDISEDNAVYPGDFSVIHDALADMKKYLRKSLFQVREVSESVIAGAERLSAADAAPADSGYEPDVPPGRLGDIRAYADKAAEGLSESNRALAGEEEKLLGLAGAIDTVNECADSINDIIAQIEDIAFQTNILALNAAVEASAAGEYGRSFAVVADEVRDLAGKSSRAAKSTSELIKNTLSSLSEGAALARSSADELREISANGQKTARYIDDIKAAAKEQEQAEDSLKETFALLSERATSSAAADTERAEAVAAEAKRLRSIADSFRV